MVAGLPIAIAFGDNKAWCPIKVVGPCIAAPIAVVIAVFVWPASLFWGCCATDKGKEMWMYPGSVYNSIISKIPI